MEMLAKEIFMLLQVISWMTLSAVGKPLQRCSLTSEIELYDPTDTQAEIECMKCSECPEGQGLSPQCGTRHPKGIKIECKLCQANDTYSNKHGIESCQPCKDCGLRNVIESCTPYQNRECGDICPQGYFLDHNHFCQECYFCCDSVREDRRRQECKDIGMPRNWQCEKTDENQRCKEKTTTLPHISLPRSTSATDNQKTTESTTENDDPANVLDSTNKDKGKEQNEAVDLRVVLGVASIILIILSLTVITSKRTNQFWPFSRTRQANVADNSTELIPLNSISEHTDSGRASPQDNTELMPLNSIGQHTDSGRASPQDNTELMPLNSIGQHTDSGRASPQDNMEFIPLNSISEHTDSGQTSPQDNTELIPLNSISQHTDSGQASPQDDNLTTEEHDESGKEVLKLNPADIPEDCRISDMEHLRNEKGDLMLFFVKRKLDALETLNQKTWRSVGQVFQVSIDDLNLIETEYMARRSPTEGLLDLLKNRMKEPTMREFVEALIICGRLDVADFICNWPWAKRFVPVRSETIP